MMSIDNSYVIKPKCSMLIDQYKYVVNSMGEVDPLGHTCYNDAVWSDGIPFYCESCMRDIMNNSPDITKPLCNTVELWDSFVHQLVWRHKEIFESE